MNLLLQVGKEAWSPMLHTLTKKLCSVLLVISGLDSSLRSDFLSHKGYIWQSVHARLSASHRTMCAERAKSIPKCGQN